MARSTIYFACLTLIVTGSLLLRFLSPSLSLVEQPLTSQPAPDEPADFVLHPWVAPGEETRGPARIISMAPSITEAVCALGLRDRLVGRTQYCQYPPGVDRVPAVGALTDPNYEKIKSLRPEVVFVTQNSYEVIRNLEALHIRVEPIPHETLEEVYTGIARIGELCGRPRTAQTLIDSISGAVARLSRAAALHAHPQTRVLLALEMKVPPQALWIAGPGTFLDTMLQLAGYANAAQGMIKKTYDDPPLEKLVEVNPDAILDFGPPRTSAQNAELYASWQQIPGLRAIANRRVVQIGGPQWLSAGPRIAIELHRFITALQ